MVTVKELDERVKNIEELLGIIPSPKNIKQELPPIFNIDERVKKIEPLSEE